MTARKAEVAAPNATGTAVAVRPQGLPMQIASSTIRIPKLKKGEPTSFASDYGVGFLDLYTTTGGEDTSPQIVGKADPKSGTKPGNEVRFHVLAIREGRSESIDNNLVTYQLQGGRWISAYDGTEAGPQSYATQTYTVCLPEVDPERPFDLMLYRSSMPAAKNINNAIANHCAKGGDAWDLAFDLSVVKREKGTNRYGVFQAFQAEADPAHVALALDLAVRVAPILAQGTPAPPVDRPEI